jgi:hypothetical protein
MREDADPEQSELIHELVDHSDRFLGRIDQLRAAEAGTDPEPAAEVAREVVNIAKAQEAIGDEVETTDDLTIDTAAERETALRRSAPETRERQDVDDALIVATDRLKETQETISDRLHDDEVPDAVLADESVRRADDVGALAHEAARAEP